MESIEDRLKQEEYDDGIKELLDDCLHDIKRARSAMGRHYDEWDYALETFRQVRWEDAQDERSKRKGEPTKQTIPLTFAQIQTLVTYLTLLYTQNQRVFEYIPTGGEDAEIREECELIVDREVRMNEFNPKLVAFLLDIARFNLGIFKTSWISETRKVKRSPEEEIAFNTLFGDLGLEIELSDGQVEVEEEDEVVVREGTTIYNVSPFHWFCDPSFPIHRWQEGMFAFDEMSFTSRDLKNWDRMGQAHGVEFVEAFSKELWGQWGRDKYNRFDGLEPESTLGSAPKVFPVIVTEMQRKLVPSEYGLSDSDQEEIWIIRIANDSRIISCEALEDANMRFNYYVGMMTTDNHAELADSLSSVIDKLQETVTWLINSRIEAVKQNLEKQLVVNTNYVEAADLQTRAPFIRLKKSAPLMSSPEQFVMQLKTNDPTTTHIQDAEALIRFMQMSSGVNENAMGGFHSGRRSATEAKNVASGAAARMKVIAMNIWSMALSPLGKNLLLNARQYMSEDVYVRIVGEEAAAESWELFHKENWWELVGGEDFFTFDSTSPSEKAFLAQSLQELVIALMGNPEILMQTQLDPTKLIERIYELRGITNIQQFRREAPAGGLVPGQMPGVAPLPGSVSEGTALPPGAAALGV